MQADAEQQQCREQQAGAEQQVCRPNRTGERRGEFRLLLLQAIENRGDARVGAALRLGGERTDVA